MKTAILSFTHVGTQLADRLAGLDWIGPEIVRLDAKKQSARQFVAEQFGSCELLVFVGAAAIAVRLIAPWLSDKAHDPAVIVIDELGQFVIPILSGHLGGANQMARLLAADLQTQVVITTATDLHQVFAIDVWSRENGCVIPDIATIKAVSGALLAGQTVGWTSDWPWTGHLPELLADCSSGSEAGQADHLPAVGIWLSGSTGAKPFRTTLQVIPRTLVLGAGCRKDTDPAAFEQWVLDTLTANQLRLEAVACLASIDIKRNERCLVEFCQKYQLPMIFYSATELGAVEGDFVASEFVQQITGVNNVSERSAVLASQGHLLLPRQTRAGMTLALAKKPWKGVF